MYDDMIKWFDAQIETAKEERQHACREGLMHMLISSKIVAYETAKQHLWELNMLAEVKEKQSKPLQVPEQKAACIGNEDIKENYCIHYATCRWDVEDAISVSCDGCRWIEISKG